MNKLILLILIIMPLSLFSAYITNLPTQVTQPDGTVLNLLASGDEFYNKLHDNNGYTIIQSQIDGYYYYAVKNGDDLVPSIWRVGSTNPADVIITPNLNISEAAYKAKARAWKLRDNPNIRTPQTGTVNNLCVFIRFSNQTEFEIPRYTYDEKFNAVGDSANSLRNYYQTVSYNQLDIISTSFPECAPDQNLSYQDSNPRSYYLPFNAVTNPNGYTDDEQRIDREQTLLANAIAAIANQVPAGLNIDADNDNHVDNVCFIIRGPHSAWADLLWAHRWGLYYTEAYINGKQVMDYTFQPENQNDVYVLCHEMFHSIGAPDLYHYTFNGVSPAGCWDIMESGKGHMGAYMKQRYGGWLQAPNVISQSGTYILNPLSSNTNNYYRINVSGHSYEYFILEYRKRNSDYLESNLPNSGLLIYRIKPNENGNAEGPPDEVYIYRSNGTQSINGDVSEATFCAESYRTEFNDFTNPQCVWTNGTLAHLNISNVSVCGETISFQYSTTATNLPPIVNITSPVEDAILVPGAYSFGATATVPDGTITQVTFNLDGNDVSTLTESPYSNVWIAGTTQLGYHDLTVTAYTSGGLQSSKHIRFRVIDHMQPNWFSWATDTPVYTSYGRGFLPIQVAIDLDLGLEEFVVKKLYFNIQDDNYGDPEIPGMVSAKINRFSNGIITTETLLDLGNFISPMNGRFEVDITSNTILNNQIALIINLYEYQNIVFDENGITGHSWLTEPDRPWADALSKGMVGAADIGLKLQNPYVANDDNITPPDNILLSSYPNPFKARTNIVYTLPNDNDAIIGIYNLKGQKVNTLLKGKQTKGKHTLVWNGTDDAGKTVGSGIYLVKLLTNGKTHLMRKIILSK